MSKRPSRRKRLRRDPLNQRPHRLRAWAQRHGYGPAVSGASAPPHTTSALYSTPRSRGRTWRDIFYRFERLRNARTGYVTLAKAQPHRKIYQPPDEPIMVFTIGSGWL